MWWQWYTNNYNKILNFIDSDSKYCKTIPIPKLPWTRGKWQLPWFFGLTRPPPPSSATTSYVSFIMITSTSSLLIVWTRLTNINFSYSLHLGLNKTSLNTQLNLGPNKINLVSSKLVYFKICQQMFWMGRIVTI